MSGSPPPDLAGRPLLYDGSFDGLLCAFVLALRAGCEPAGLAPATSEPTGGRFGAPVVARPDPGEAEGARQGLERRAPGLVARLHHAWLSERPGVDLTLLRLVRAVAAEGPEAMHDWRFLPARTAEQLARRVQREVHRMHAFVRFERRDGDRWVAPIRPEYHVLPLLEEHFAARYPAMRWALLDVRRRLALVHTPVAERAAGAPACHVAPAPAVDAPDAEDEARYQAMWRTYIRAVDIPARRNPALHHRHVPKRYCPYLTEKRPAGAPPPRRPA